MVRGVPSGELYLEDLATGQRSKITDRVVLNAAISPTNDGLVAFAFAGGSSFGLAIADLGTGRIDTVVSSNIYSEILQWSENGNGVYCFETTSQILDPNSPDYSPAARYFERTMHWEGLDTGTANQDEKLGLQMRFVPVTQEARDSSAAVYPKGFPSLDSPLIPEVSLGSFRADPDPMAENEQAFRIVSFDGESAVYGNNLLGSGKLSIRNLKSGTEIGIGKGQIVKVFRQGFFVRELSDSGTELKFLDWYGRTTVLGITAVNYNVPLQSGVMIQGGAAYSAPGNCNLTAHFGSLEYAYDFQNQTVGAHALAAADGLVVLTVSSVTCNSVQTTCPDYVAGGCAGSFLGNVVVIQHADGTYSKYAHMQTDSPQAVVGTVVDQGLYIGRQGHTGSTSGTFNSCGDHLHFQRQVSPDIYGQSVAVNFADVPVQPLSSRLATRQQVARSPIRSHPARRVLGSVAAAPT